MRGLTRQGEGPVGKQPQWIHALAIGGDGDASGFPVTG